MWLFYYFNFERNYGVLKSKSQCILFNKNINFNKNKTKWKIEIPTHSFGETNVVLQLMQESQKKGKTVMRWISRKKKEEIFCTVYFVQRKLFWHIWFISIIVYKIHFQNVHTFTYQKTLFHTHFCCFLKSSKIFSVSLKLQNDATVFRNSFSSRSYSIYKLKSKVIIFISRRVTRNFSAQGREVSSDKGSAINI